MTALRPGSWGSRDVGLAAAVSVRRSSRREPVLTGNCPIREHAGDGVFVGRCDHAVYDGVCPRHGRVADYPTRDDREVAVSARSFEPAPEHHEEER